ncbi:unnamed protein product [Prunus armeniaca]|uniref:Uncharacterized protein n=1 Tax=Prunus armeniaca TaxID=36596 RepID=A0A6J5VE07_PRUAR|nr:unnamed protein product [Prunus armeniaca]CAB4316738.1 unnamed protein product [Prunus armeniaca]
MAIFERWKKLQRRKGRMEEIGMIWTSRFFYSLSPTSSRKLINRTVKTGANDGNKVVTEMPSFVPPVPTSNPTGTEGSTIRSSRISDFGTLEQTLGFRIEDAVDIGRSM